MIDPVPCLHPIFFLRHQSLEAGLVAAVEAEAEEPTIRKPIRTAAAVMVSAVAQLVVAVAAEEAEVAVAAVVGRPAVVVATRALEVRIELPTGQPQPESLQRRP